MFGERKRNKGKSLVVAGVARDIASTRPRAEVLMSPKEVERRRLAQAWRWWDQEGRERSEADLAAADRADTEREEQISGLRRSLDRREPGERVRKVVEYRLNPMTPARAAKEAAAVLVEEENDPVQKMQLIASLAVEEKAERDRRAKEKNDRRLKNEAELREWLDGGGSRKAFKEAAQRVADMVGAGMTEEQMEQAVKLGKHKARVFRFGKDGTCEQVDQEVGTVETYLLQAILDERNAKRRDGHRRAAFERAREQTGEGVASFSRALGGLAGERVVGSLTRLALAAGEEAGRRYDGSVRQLADGNPRREQQVQQRRAVVQAGVDNSPAMRILRRMEQALSGVRDEVHGSRVRLQGRGENEDEDTRK